MTKLIWDQVGTKFYETGVDRGVLYLSNGTVGVAWNGLTSVDEKLDDDTSPLYLDGLKYYDLPSYSEYQASVNAITYPDEFEIFNGYLQKVTGLFFDNQPAGTFGLSYRTLVGNDVLNEKYGYRIHILYNLKATPTDRDFVTMSDSVDLTDFSWDISGVPAVMTTRTGFAPTTHIIIDSNYLNSSMLSDLEGVLYGTSTTNARLPSLDELVYMLEFLIRITDNGDGTWTAFGPAALLTDFGDGTFQIDSINSTTISTDTYQITDTP